MITIKVHTLRINVRQFYFTLPVATLLLFSVNVFGQLRKFPLQKGELSSHARTRATKLDTIQLDTIALPFWDDFSKTTGSYPDTTKWFDVYRVLLNNSMAINQPTLNVVTFDGLDSLSLAYNPQQVLVTGFNDNLSSQAIDLSEAGVAINERSTVYLSFFYQWQGKGEAPDQDDYLSLQFFASDKTWQDVMTINSKSSYDNTVFYDTIIQVTDERFFHSGFRFRFRNFGRQSGPYDTWNIDYVYLNKNRTVDDLVFDDRAVASPLTSLLGDYWAIPYKHFLLEPFIDSVQFDIQNLNNVPNTSLFNVFGTFTNYLPTDTVTFSKTFFSENRPVGKGSPDQRTNLIQANSRLTNFFDIEMPDVTDPQQFNPEAKAVDVKLKMQIFTKDTLHTSGKFDYRINDTISGTWHLKNYYAYDDGTAEFTAGLIEPGNLVAYRFDMVGFEALQADTLKAIQYYFPAYGISPNQTVSFYVFHNDNGKPGEVWQSYPPRTLQQKGLNEFQEMPLIPALLINEPSFFIGWRQPASGKALIGLDNDTDTGDRIFVNTNSSDWYQNQVVRGSLMIRPVFGKGPLEDDVNVGVEDKVSGLSFYPNPSNGTFFIEGEFHNLQIFNSTGSSVFFESEKQEQRTLIHIPRSSGLFLLRITKNDQSFTHKVVISR